MHSTANTFKTFVLLAALGGLMVATGKTGAGRPGGAKGHPAAPATKYIVNSLTSRRVTFAKLLLTHPPTAERVARLRSR